ncbi:DEAD/DEAH box helicase [Schleiferia thermophila]|jgi:ATP-dependent RNA helicase DeaD|uniref:DEAD/DEAH box helicase n=1 Tax=Schleiferia thermophila TaxID=884107 RepID=UPI0004E79B26|nr:DEAD/DEAH box helicase [Schleiferia thermophila]KFD38476.1 DEAD/DEAH box helicase [Schleiferia thermophila str. Yellowstone]
MNTFEWMGLSEALLKAITEMGYKEPTPVQQEAIPLLLQEDTDIISLAQTGTGKTAAFGLPLLSKIKENSGVPQALILSPTRELCIQIAGELEKFSKYQKSKIVAVYGGANMSTQIKQIKAGADVLVATPGRLMDLMERGVIQLNDIKIVVLDEADEMLSMGFKEDIDAILSQTPEDRQTWLFSATMPEDIKRISKSYMRNPKYISVAGGGQLNENIQHIYHLIDGRDRIKVLTRVLDFYPDIYAIVFCQTKIETQQVADKLIDHGYPAGSLHGDMSQAQREQVMNAFRKKAATILVATDVAARGIDVEDVTHVIHYHLPDDLESFTHRSGRTARAGKKGTSIALVSKNELHRLRTLEKIIKRKIQYAKVPSGMEVCTNQMQYLINRITTEEVNPLVIEEFRPMLDEMLEKFHPRELIEKIFSMEFNRLLEMYRNAPDLNVSPEKGGKSGESPYSTSGIRRWYINIGTKDGMYWQDVKDLLKEKGGLGRDEISGVETLSSFSTFKCSEEAAYKIQKAIQGYSLQGRKIFIKEDSYKKDALRKNPGTGREESPAIKRTRKKVSLKS